MQFECGVVISNWDGDDKSHLAAENIVWDAVSGYITAKNEDLAETVGMNTKPQSKVQQVIKYCRENPLRRLYNAVVYTYIEIKKIEGS
tara:strand:+ start:467 stop:730 length:264 start_codon:yes stop_codon:yes gene_type:complete